MKRVLDSYVPRHLRLGVCCGVPSVPSYQDVVEDIPVVDKGHAVYSERVIKRVPTDEVMDQYKLSAFRLSALVDAGVPLQLVNVNASQNHRIDELYSICKNLDESESFVNHVLAQKKERESWFKDPDELTDSEKTELNEIY